MKDLIIKKLDTQISHCNDCQDTDGQLKGFIRGLKHAKIIVADCVNEPTTAEMLLWLAENTNIGVTKTCMLVNSKTLCWNNETAEILAKKGQKAIMVKDLTEAIKQSYDWAKQEERK